MSSVGMFTLAVKKTANIRIGIERITFKTFLTRKHNINLCKSVSHQNDHTVIFGALAIIKKLNRSAGTGRSGSELLECR